MSNRSKTRKYDERVNDVKIMGKYIVENSATIRQAADYGGISKTVLHKDIENILSKEDSKLYDKVRKVLDKNKAERHSRGGLATKIKFAKDKNNRD